jgi:hypothetical protein
MGLLGHSRCAVIESGNDQGMLPIGCPPAIPDDAPAPLARAVAATAKARPAPQLAARAPSTRRITVTVEPFEPEHPMRLGTGMLIDTFA